MLMDLDHRDWIRHFIIVTWQDTRPVSLWPADVTCKSSHHLVVFQKILLPAAPLWNISINTSRSSRYTVGFIKAKILLICAVHFKYDFIIFCLKLSFPSQDPCSSSHSIVVYILPCINQSLLFHCVELGVKITIWTCLFLEDEKNHLLATQKIFTHSYFSPFTPTDRFRSIQHNEWKSPLKLLSVF